MKLNKVLEVENNDFRKEINELRDRDLANFVHGWGLFQENQRLWDVLEGLACELVLYRLGYVHIHSGSKQLLCTGLHFPGKEMK